MGFNPRHVLTPRWVLYKRLYFTKGLRQIIVRLVIFNHMTHHYLCAHSRLKMCPMLVVCLLPDEDCCFTPVGNCSALTFTPTFRTAVLTYGWKTKKYIIFTQSILQCSVFLKPLWGAYASKSGVWILGLFKPQEVDVRPTRLFTGIILYDTRLEHRLLRVPSKSGYRGSDVIV